jgi:ubiquinone/menaquinone biosynthesis C-methylase UbiE
MSDEKELAYRYDLIIAPEWRDRFDILISENIELPVGGRILEVNCGTGGYAIELAEKIRSTGEVTGVDPSAARVEIAQAKAQIKKTPNVAFEQSLATELRFESYEFDAVIGDASLLPPDEIEDVLEEMIRVAEADARAVLKLTTRGSFDEFFSIYWEALNEAGLTDALWQELEALIKERMTIADAEQMARRVGLNQVSNHTAIAVFEFADGYEFLDSPLISDTFLADWMAMVPEARQPEVREHIVSIIDRDLHDGPFEVSVKATLITGIK